ncbi:hypothetical protein [Pseudohoeflea coraliihabitans]|uniref:Uncharacterized protein n=1 Tax=Pseudohoeflea coraliihabitans TaxID=2860393 RepID=A0ABS6WTF0_9HYPH|nr:hypothetical protein [Pseudohoeflea sp. DP4N28-3]MBW3099236.1 hypothetical protein [Pseudohoeflea sp. DP4N28-3]
MADTERMQKALINAHRAGDTVAAKKLANALKAAKAGASDKSGFANKVDAFGRGIVDMATFGFADEIGAAVETAGRKLLPWRDEKPHNEVLSDIRQENTDLAAAHPGSYLSGQVLGGVGTAGGLAKSGATLLTRKAMQQGGKQAIGRAAAEGAAYGGAYGAGSAEGGLEDRARGAGMGAVTGAVAGAGVQKLGNTLATRRAGKAAGAAAPASDELKQATNALYQQARQAGVTIKPQATAKLAANLKLAAGNLNDKLRPNTSGIVDDLAEIAGQPMTLEQLDELRQVIGQSMQRAQPQDQRTLMRMKEMLDSFANNISPSDITGDIAGFDVIKQARALNARKAKTEIVENILDMAQVNGEGKFTQSGVANALRQEMRSLYKKIQSGKEKGFSPDEVELIRLMAKGGTSSKMMRLFAKFAPRGVVSFGVGQGVGTLIPGGNILVPGAGHFAAQNVDNAMIRGSQALRTSAATGQMPPGSLRQIGTSATRPLIAPSAMELEATRGRIAK